MNGQFPHYLLISRVEREKTPGRWRFVLQPLDGRARIEAADVEPDLWGERLELLTVIRALESLDQPSRVTLVGSSRYVQEGVQYGVSQWKENGWRWEYFGQMTPVRDADLWQRVERLLQFHRVECRRRRFDAAHASLPGPHWHLANRGKIWIGGIKRFNWVKYSVLLSSAGCLLWLRVAAGWWQKVFGIRGV
ncbi:MAG: hypothetical protein JW959_11185 [Pirellulales bacterium]|nr:hypothetical protein [Pirellulales bacterium]